MWGIIATWRMALEGVDAAAKDLAKGALAADAIEKAIKDVEDNEYYKSVGYGALPNKRSQVELDSAFMNGDTLDVGAIAGLKNFANPISISKSLCGKDTNWLLVGAGAEDYADRHGFERKNMLTERANILYHNKMVELGRAAADKLQDIKPYDGHDTVGEVCLDTKGTVIAATSTSGLFMKEPGRVGDSPCSGSGFYADSEAGGATATGLGEDVMRGCCSYQIVELMRGGMSPQEACERVTYEFAKKLKQKRGVVGDMSFVAMNNKGEFGAATNTDNFSFVVATEKIEPTVFVCTPGKDSGICTYRKATDAWMKAYMDERTKPVERL